MPETTYLTPREVAEILHVAPVTVRHWASKGWLQAERTPGGHRRFARGEVERLAREHGFLPVPGESGGLHVLIVDDDHQFVRLLREMLEGEPEVARVTLAHDGFEAGWQVSAARPDLVLLDLRMPGIDGFAVCTRLKADPLTRGIRVMAMSGCADAGDRRRILEAGAEDFLAKPFDQARLRQALRLAGMEARRP